jgi:hypothetical protein
VERPARQFEEPPPGPQRQLQGQQLASGRYSPLWARLLGDQRHIADFTRWKEPDAYQKALERLLRYLKVGASPAPDG